MTYLGDVCMEGFAFMMAAIAYVEGVGGAKESQGRIKIFSRATGKV